MITSREAYVHGGIVIYVVLADWTLDGFLHNFHDVEKVVQIRIEWLLCGRAKSDFVRMHVFMIRL